MSFSSQLYIISSKTCNFQIEKKIYKGQMIKEFKEGLNKCCNCSYCNCIYDMDVFSVHLTFHVHSILVHILWL